MQFARKSEEKKHSEKYGKVFCETECASFEKIWKDENNIYICMT